MVDRRKEENDVTDENDKTMAEVKHTPGPWTARRMHTGGYDIMDSRNRDVVTVYGGGVETESREANARLIAAAPGLFEAARLAFYSEVGLTLAEAVEDAGWTWPSDAPETVSLLAERLRAALSRATTQQEGR